MKSDSEHIGNDLSSSRDDRMKPVEFKTTLVKEKNSIACGINLPFAPKEKFGKARAPVRVTINNHTFRTTTFTMGDRFWIPVNTENRTLANISAGDQIDVTMEVDTEPRIVTPPEDLLNTLRKKKTVFAKWEKLSYTHQKEFVRWIEEAKKPETRRRRIDKTIEQVAEGTSR